MAATILLGSSPRQPRSLPCRPLSRASGSACARPASFPRLQAGGGHLMTRGDDKQVLLPWPPPFIYGYLPWQPCSLRSTRLCPSMRAFKAPCARPIAPSLSMGERRIWWKICQSLHVAPSNLRLPAGNTNWLRSLPFKPALPQGHGSPSLHIEHQLRNSYASIMVGSPIGWSCHCHMFPGLGSPRASIVCLSINGPSVP